MIYNVPERDAEWPRQCFFPLRKREGEGLVMKWTEEKTEMKNVRWVDATTAASLTSLGSSGSVYHLWYAVADDDEVVATVSGCGMQWSVCTSIPNQPMKHAAFISEAAAKRRAEHWLHPDYQFEHRNTNWTAVGGP